MSSQKKRRSGRPQLCSSSLTPTFVITAKYNAPPWAAGANASGRLAAEVPIRRDFSRETRLSASKPSSETDVPEMSSARKDFTRVCAILNIAAFVHPIAFMMRSYFSDSAAAKISGTSSLPTPTDPGTLVDIFDFVYMMLEEFQPLPSSADQVIGNTSIQQIIFRNQKQRAVPSPEPMALELRSPRYNSEASLEVGLTRLSPAEYEDLFSL